MNSRDTCKIADPSISRVQVGCVKIDDDEFDIMGIENIDNQINEVFEFKVIKTMISINYSKINGLNSE